MASVIPAIRSRMGGLDYFVSVVTLGEAARMIEYVEEVDGWNSQTPAELKLQRKLNVARVERELVPYLVQNDDHFYSALTVELRSNTAGPDGKGQVLFDVQHTFPGGVEFGVLTLDGTESLYALDGQHRLKSIELGIRQRPDLAREHIALILVPFVSIPRSQTLFSDLNRYAKGPSKSISILFTHRETLARISRRLAHEVPLLKERVNMETNSLSSATRHFITLATLYEMTRALLGDEERASTLDEDAAVAQLVAVWDVLTNSVKQWSIVAADEEHPGYLRQRYLNMHGVAQQAIGLVTAHARATSERGWPRTLSRLRKVDWQLTNAEWQGVAMFGGRVNNTSSNIRLLADALAEKVGLPALPKGQPVPAA